MISYENMTGIAPVPAGGRFLLCDTSGNVDDLLSVDVELVTSPIQCLTRAVDQPPEIILIRFGKMPIRERQALVELSGALKRNKHSRNIPVLALLDGRHQRLLEYLHRAGVDYVAYVDDNPLDSRRLWEIIDTLGPDDLVERHLKIICPFLHYGKIDAKHEMRVCGAYLDRMVLGGNRLRDICETEHHFYCEYYLVPKRRG